MCVVFFCPFSLTLYLHFVPRPSRVCALQVAQERQAETMNASVQRLEEELAKERERAKAMQRSQREHEEAKAKQREMEAQMAEMRAMLDKERQVCVRY